MLGFQLDEGDLLQKGFYYVKYVEPNSASALAGLKEGDKITKINGKSTQGMSYEEFLHEITIAQQQQLRNNMIHLMVMRRSAKAHGSSSYLATATSSISNLSGPTVLPIKNNLYSSSSSDHHLITNSTTSNLNANEKTSSFIDEGYVPGSVTSATSSSTTTALGAASSTNIPCNLVSVVRVTSPTVTSGKT